MKERILDYLKVIGFTENEATVYMHLIKNPGDNGTQISKVLELSRSAIYRTLESLESKGIIKLIPALDDRKNYKVFDPDIMLTTKKAEIDNIISQLKSTLSSIYDNYNYKDMYNLDRGENRTYKLIDMLSSSEKSIYIKGDIDEKYLSKISENVIIHTIKSDEDVIVIKDEEEMILNNVYTKNTDIIRNIVKMLKLEMEK